MPTKLAVAVLIATIVAAVPSQSVLLAWPFLSATDVAGPGDLNGDGIPDVVIGGGGCVTALSGFNGAQIWQTCGIPELGNRIARAGDLDGDGKSEIVAAAPYGISGPGGPTLILNGATGAVVRSFPDIASSVDGGYDFNGDAVPDQVATAQGIARVHSGVNGAVLLTYNAATCGSCGSTFASAVFLNDVSGDGLADLALSWWSPVPSIPGYNTIVVLRGPNGVLHSQTTNPSSLGGFVRNAGDLTGDGRDDVTLGEAGGFTFPAYDVSPPGVINPATSLWTLSTNLSRAAPIGDLTGDNRTELAVINTTGPVYWLGDTRIVSGANGAVLGVVAGGPGAVAVVGDVNGDGINDFVRSYLTLSGSITVPHLEVVSPVTLPSGPVSNLGGACGSYATNLFPATSLRIAQTWSLGVLNAAPSTAGILALDVGPDTPTPLGACTIHVNLAHASSWLVLPLATDAAGSGSASILVPSIPLAAGATVVVQAAVFGTASPLGFDLSNGVLATAGF